MLANRAPELAAHYSIPVEPQEVSAEEVPDFVNAYLYRPTGNTTEHSSTERQRTRGNHHYRYNRQSSALPKYNQQASRLDVHVYSHNNKAYNRNRCNSSLSVNISHHTTNNSHNNIGNMQHSTSDMHPSNTTEILGLLQSQILGLQTHPLQQSMLNSIKIFDGSNTAEFTAWAQSIENAAKLCHLDALSIALSKLQGVLLKSTNYLETKETSAGKTLIWSTLKQHLTSNYSEIPYVTHAINAV